MKVRINAILLVALMSLGLPVVHAADNAADEVMVSNPYARAVSPVQKNSAIFMTLINHGKAEHAVVGVSGDVAQAVELHTNITEGGMVRMRPLDKVTVPAGGQAELKPGSHHVMLIGLNRTLEEGDMVNIELEFEDGSKKIVMAPVKKVIPMNEGEGSHDMPQMKKHNM